MKPDPILIIIISTFYATAVNGQDLTSKNSVDPKFIEEANVILKQYGSDVQNGIITYPYPWMEDANEIHNIKSNKVKTINTKSSKSDYDTNGRLIRQQIFKEIQFANQRKVAGSKDEFNRNEDGIVSLRLTTNSANPGDVHKRQYYYAGDTLHSKWTINDIPKGIGLSYQNIFINKDLVTKRNTIYIYKRTSLRKGYSISERMMADKEQKFKELNKFKFNSEGLLIEYVSSTFREEYLHNSNGLIIELKRFIQYDLKEKVCLLEMIKD